jgi:hypothetical protein
MQNVVEYRVFARHITYATTLYRELGAYLDRMMPGHAIFIDLCLFYTTYFIHDCPLQTVIS